MREAARLFPGQVAVGIDARDGLVAVEGWAKTVNVMAVELGRRFEDAGVAAIIMTQRLTVTSLRRNPPVPPFPPGRAP